MAPCRWLSLLICSALSLQTAEQTEQTEPFGTVKVEGKYVPKTPEFASMVLYKKRLWTFGGDFPGSSSSRLGVDLNCFDIDSKTWTKVAADGTPEARSGHGAVVDFAGTMWLWGGVRSNGSFVTGVYSLNLNEIDLHPKDGKNSGAWHKVKVKGTTPRGRWLHSAVMDGTGMVVFGGLGFGVDEDFFADVHYLDFEKKMWSEIKCQGDVPSARGGHGAAMTSLGDMWVYGGQGKDLQLLEDLYYLELKTKNWVKIAAKGVSPGPSQQHFQVIDAAGRMWLAGGASNAIVNRDRVFYIDTSMDANAEWKEVEEFRGAAVSSGGTAAIETNGRLWCYGGVILSQYLPATFAWLDTNQPTPSTATTSTHPFDPAGQSGGVGVGTILVILLLVAAIAAGVLFFLRRRREMRLLEVQEPRQVELGPRA